MGTYARISISDLLPYYDCPYKGITRRYYSAWTGPTRAMRRGTAIHSYIDQLSKAGRPIHAFPLDHDLEEEVRPILELLDLYLCPPPFPIASTETPISIEAGHDIEIVGRLDMVIPDGTAEWSGQAKTISKGVALGPFLEKVRLSPHEITYRHARRQAGKTVLGTKLLIIRTELSKAQAADNVPRLEWFDLTADADTDADLFENHICPAARALVRETPSWRNYTACTTLFGRCPLFDHCHNGWPVSDCLTVPLEDRYTDVPKKHLSGSSGSS